MERQWQDRLRQQLLKQYGSQQGKSLGQKYCHAFPTIYRDSYSTQTALRDIRYLETLSAKQPLRLLLYMKRTAQHNSPLMDYPLHVRLFQWQHPIALSSILPMLENFGLSIYSEVQSQLHFPTDSRAKHQLTTVWITDFSMQYHRSLPSLLRNTKIFADAFEQTYLGIAENDGFNKLILGANLTWQEVVIVRTYVKYLHQIRFRLSEAYIETALTTHPLIVKQLVTLFQTRHQPKLNAKKRTAQAKTIEKAILTSLDTTVDNADDDHVLRRLLAIILATCRTNYFKITDYPGKILPFLAIKLASRTIPNMPLPTPLYEIFVYSSRFAGIHLRYAKIARGGIRYSDRLEDFRTEILDLMKAQTVKNALIVPSGAKGGFVLKRTLPQITREAIQQEVTTCYQLFISALLDLTDNITGKKITQPLHVVCHDDHDPYLVVAADKGTATFSDLANELAKQRHFWLDDAFASGGKTGYDHKKMGITARGVWESIKRHFRELERDIHQEPISVIGIGDMSGDVFGNGMLYSHNIKLIAAFNHSHIFLDPDPDPLTTYTERARLFHLPTSSWEDYNKNCLSPGGGIFNRRSKTITLSKEAKTVLAITTDTLTPNELILAILKAPVDLLFNGGIGTYVKSSLEGQEAARDRDNDDCRVNGNELRCKVVGEGGNLGFTQLGRIEFALQGGLINTDFIDNAAGVNCSDHEVNLKILLAEAIQQQKLSPRRRNHLLAKLHEDIAQLVLADNYHQALVMSFSTFHAQRNMSLYQAYISTLEEKNVLNRQVDCLPEDKTLLQRKTDNQGLTRPELATLLAYTKIYLKHEILASNLPEDHYLHQIIQTAFPAAITKRYRSLLQHHSLKRDIIATQFSNYLVNQMGMTFVYRLQTESGAAVADIIRAFTIAANIFDAFSLRRLIESLDYKIPMSTQYEMLFNIRHLINLAARWFLHSHYLHQPLEHTIKHFAPRVKQLETVIPAMMTGLTKKYLRTLIEQFLQAGLSSTIAQRIATYRAMYTALNVIDIASQHKFDLLNTAKIYFITGEKFNLVWFRDQIVNDAREGYWNALARLNVRDELDIVQRTLTIAMINQDNKTQTVSKLIKNWLNVHANIVAHWNNILSMLHNTGSVDYSHFFVAIRQLLTLI